MWTLKVWEPNRSLTRVTYSDAFPGGIVAPFRWTTDGYGTSRQLTFRAKPSAVDIRPRDLIELRIGSSASPAFFGVVTQSWPSDDDGLREYVVIGLKETLRQRFVPWTHYPYQDTGTTFADLAQNFNSPIWYLSSRIQNSGYKLELVAPGAVDYFTILEDITKRTPNFVWGVDAEGYFFFKPASSEAITVDYNDPGIRWLPVRSDEIVTKVIGWGGYAEDGDGKYTFEGNVGSVSSQFPIASGKWPLVADLYEDPEHSKYQAEKAFAMPSIIARYGKDTEIGARLYNDESRITVYVTGDGYCYYDGNPDPMFDGNSSTYTTVGAQDLTAGNEVRVYLTNPNNDRLAPNGFFPTAIEVDYMLMAAGMGAGFWFEVADAEDPGSIQAQNPQTIGLSANTLYTMALYGGPPLRSLAVMFTSTDASNCSQARIYAVRLWGIDLGDPSKVGPALIQKPYSTPVEVVFNDFISPKPNLTVNNAPSGTITGEIEEWEYVWGPQERTSKARLAQKNTQTATAIRQISLSAEFGATQNAAVTMKRK